MNVLRENRDPTCVKPGILDLGATSAVLFCRSSAHRAHRDVSL